MSEFLSSEDNHNFDHNFDKDLPKSKKKIRKRGNLDNDSLKKRDLGSTLSEIDNFFGMRKEVKKEVDQMVTNILSDLPEEPISHPYVPNSDGFAIVEQLEGSEPKYGEREFEQAELPPEEKVIPSAQAIGDAIAASLAPEVETSTEEEQSDVDPNHIGSKSDLVSFIEKLQYRERLSSQELKASVFEADEIKQDPVRAQKLKEVECEERKSFYNPEFKEECPKSQWNTKKVLLFGGGGLGIILLLLMLL